MSNKIFQDKGLWIVETRTGFMKKHNTEKEAKETFKKNWGMSNHLQKITTRAKQLKKSFPGTSWINLVKKAKKLVKRKRKIILIFIFMNHTSAVFYFFFNRFG